MSTNLFVTIDSDTLDKVTGGGSKASSLMLDKLNSRYGNDGVVSFIGHPKFTATGTAGVEHGTGKFDVNALWGGDTQRSFSGNVNLNSGSVSGLHTRVLSSQ